MKYIINLFIPLILIGSIFSCQKEENKKNKVNFFSPPENSISVVVHNSIYSPMDVSTIDIHGGFFNKKGERLDIDKISINGIEIEKNKKGVFYSHFNYRSNEDEFESIVDKLTNGLLTLVIEDAEVGTIEASLEAQAPIKLVFQDDFEKELNKKKPFSVSWEFLKPKSQVTNRLNFNIGAVVAYHAGLANQFNAELSDVNQALYSIEDDSSDDITFTTQQLSVLPDAGSVIVYTGTGQEVTLDGDVSGTTFSYITYSSSGPVAISAVQ